MDQIPIFLINLTISFFFFFFNLHSFSNIFNFIVCTLLKQDLFNIHRFAEDVKAFVCGQSLGDIPEKQAQLPQGVLLLVLHPLLLRF